jgi:23S rRNA (cytosine1962-C5)-methyltransferase
MVILDPPAFAHKRGDVPQAVQAYGRLVGLGLAVLSRGGILVAASCSRPVSSGAFFQAVHEAAAAQRRPLREIERTAHALDHPINFKEGAYLKCLFAEAA